MIIEVNQLSELNHAAKLLLQSYPSDRVFLFYGNMGAGKTTFIKTLCEALQVEDNTSSPTFSIVNEYSSAQGPIFHFDFYRLKEEQEAYDFGYEEYFYSGNYCFIEWPEKIPNLLPEDAKIIQIEITSPNSRKITIK
ncbi:tRNA (adenosine(37)-N6)-threonylcarbamoyltransferase complex ATPase subunit type 1 TsaE [Sphingobacterium sp. SRCM116780]|uniref:tRNA (adenosine(37)-N6)-threonylcarbamoyltransferase complex ATPase subunit type 1 TsaE n=1 Tax=Sphingobacterium sp. SRCM116780 TaxID=2907623 RepID=UPI001EFF908E|nr:tRNA (adenosine(37)-N6)-threonylcarbamoyltransferase complex ATPase subunit type 1 TsaE [Sphingobacterium sp. SRCM116780]UIR55586.1 tRNA (adenosine(37)-N6)-threonylcarbamoyltransferase complex ATPase subunit type 1 TsaE [Sphingobacterium sp. SRCM116780]